MENVITAIQKYYNWEIKTEADFRKALNNCKKEELIDFIVEMQGRKAFSGICYNE